MIELTELEHEALVKALRDRVVGIKWLRDHSLSPDNQKSYDKMAVAMDALADKIEGQKPGVVQEFVLHDGVDEKKTAELHSFLESAQIIDWSSNNGGIDIWVDVRNGDTIYRYPDGSVRVLRRAE